MDFQELYYPESRFGGFTNIDGTIVFYNRVNALINPASVVVDFGCGRGRYGEDPLPYRRDLRILRGKCQQLVGIDVDPEAKCNPFLDEFRLIETNEWPILDSSVDVCLADNVLEHLEEPGLFFREARRILKTGGFVCIRTPNSYSYIGLFSRIVSNRKHLAMLQKVKTVQAEDVFPTFYRCNTISRLRRLLGQNEFLAYVYGYEAEPSYLSSSRFLYFMGVLHQRLAPQFLRVGLHAFGRKE